MMAKKCFKRVYSGELVDIYQYKEGDMTLELVYNKQSGSNIPIVRAYDSEDVFIECDMVLTK